MSTMRNVCAALFLVPLGLVTSHAAQASGPQSLSLSAGVPARLPQALPKGIHLKNNGRYTRDLCDHSTAHYCLTQVLLPKDWTPDQPIPKRGPEANGGGAQGASGMGPTELAAAYSIPASAAANGKIVAILDLPDSHALADLQKYRTQYGLPAMEACAGGTPTGSLPACFAQVSETGGASTGKDSGIDYDGETSLDMDMISAACPDCSILLVEISNLNDSDFVTGAQTAASLGAVATSMSFGGEESGSDPAGYTTSGHLVLAATGDSGYDNIWAQGGGGGGSGGTPSYPSSAPDVLAVGGTTLFQSGSKYDESAWNDETLVNQEGGSTSGCSTEFSAPSWQTAALAGTSCSQRATADVAAAAAFVSGGEVEDIASYTSGSGGGWAPVEGTSAASPMMAALLTRVGLAETISNNLGWAYANPSGFHDLGSASYPIDPSTLASDTDTTPGDESACGKLCTVGTGWDGPSGVGTPNGTALAALASGSTSTTVDAGAPPSSGSGTGSGTGTGTSTTTTTTPDAGTTSTASGSGSGSSPGSVTPTSTAAGLGDPCTGSASCMSAVCAEPFAGAAAVCTEACTGSGTSSTCIPGFACTSGYCFATSADAGASSTTPTAEDTGSGGSSGGCTTAPSNSGWSGLGWIAVGLVGLGGQRRRRAGT